MQQVTDSGTPTVPDVKRQLHNAEHELDEIVKQGGIGHKTVEQALFRVREAIAHLNMAEGAE